MGMHTSLKCLLLIVTIKSLDDVVMLLLLYPDFHITIYFMNETKRREGEISQRAMWNQKRTLRVQQKSPIEFHGWTYPLFQRSIGLQIH